MAGMWKEKKEMRMEEDVMRLLRQTQLFAAFTEDEIRGLLDLLRAKTADYPKGSFIYREGDCGVPSAIVLRGSVHIIKEDFWGNRAILSEIVRGEMFAESYACMQTEPLVVSAAAAENCSCLFLDFSPLMAAQGSAETGAAERRLLVNLIGILAGKNLFLTKKMEHLTRRTTRQKLLSYLSDVQRRAGSAAFDIPFDRQELADFLAVDRSAMSTELSKLRREGILEYRKNHFVLKQPQM